MTQQWRGNLMIASLALGILCQGTLSADDDLTIARPDLRTDAEPPTRIALLALADDPPADSASKKTPDVLPLNEEVKQLRARLEALEKSAEADQKAKEKQAKEKAEKEKADKEAKEKEKKEAETKKSLGEWKDVSTEKWNVKLGGHVQMDYINWAKSDPDIVGDDNYFSYRRLRLVADGTGYGQFDFRLQMTLEPGSGANDNEFASADVKDAYFSMNDIPGLGRLRVGNFFVPFSLEQVTNDTMNIFLERSIPTEGIFAASREVGMALYNCTPDQNITWTGGVFFDSTDDTVKTRFDDNQGYRLSGRLTWLPYFDEPSDGRYLLHTGIGILHTDDQNDVVRFRARPQIQRGPVLVDSGDLAADAYTTGNVEMALVWGRFTLQSEAFLSSLAMKSGDSTQAGGAYAHVSYFLTGENRVFERFGQHGAQFGRNRPFSNFFAVPGGVGPGAWEAKARWSNLNLTDVNRGQYNDLTAGFNWYWSDRTRIMFDWIHPITTPNTRFGATESDLLAMRFDFNW
jgi:phosphate-selective porin OprO and OprP